MTKKFIRNRSYYLGKMARVSLTKRLEEICYRYEEFMMRGDERIFKIPRDITDALGRITSREILEFSKILADYYPLDGLVKYTGNYLTALMESSPEKEFEIDLRNERGIFFHYIGYGLRGRILNVHGDLGGWVGYRAGNSRIIVNGNVGDNIGKDSHHLTLIVNGDVGNNVGYHAGNSRIIVNGNVEDNIGKDSHHLTLIVNGDVGNNIGENSRNSTIMISGKYESIADYVGEGTEIFHLEEGKWRLIYP